MNYPVVEGLTETAETSEPLHERLAAFLAQKPGGSADDIGAAVTSLESAFRRERDEKTKARIAMAISVLSGKKDYDG